MKKNFPCLLLVLLIILESLNLIQAYKIIKLNSNVDKKEPVNPKLMEIEKTDIQVNDILADNRKLNEEIKTSIVNCENKIDLLNSYYLLLIEEQRKKILDVTSADSAVDKMKNDAKKHYREKQYAACAKLCQSVLSFENNDYEIMILKFKSMYYANPSDSSKFNDLINTYEKIKNYGKVDNECKQIIEVINAEKGFTNE